MQSRIGAARARANRAHTAMIATAAALFLAAMVAARIAHPARAAQPATSSASSSVSSSSDDTSQGSGDYFNSGSTAPSQSAPQLSTGGS